MMKIQRINFVMACLVLVGIALRLARLDEPVYWVDEVATSMRVAGYTLTEVTQQLTVGVPLTVEDLQRFQQLGDRPWSATFYALTQSPEHAPLYFLLARAWVETFGNSVVTIRSLSVVLSLLTLPACFWLGHELFPKTRVKCLGTGLLAVSPLFVAYAQEARPYSLWTLALLLMNGALVRSLRSPRCLSWLAYTLALIVSLYTSLLTVLVLLGQGLVMLWVFHHPESGRGKWPFAPTVGAQKQTKISSIRGYWISTGVGLGVFLPWIWIIFNHWQTLHSNTAWMQIPMDRVGLLALWIYNLAVLFFDVPVTVDLSWETFIKVTISFGLINFMGYALGVLWMKSPRWIGALVLALALSIPLALIGIDLTLGGQRSAAARYYIPFYLGVLVAIAHLLTLGMAGELKIRPRYWRAITTGLVSLCLMSCLFQWQSPPLYQKSRNLHNGAIATIINQSVSRGEFPLLMGEPEQTLDILSLSYLLQPQTAFLLGNIADLSAFEAEACRPVFILRPSEALQSALQTSHRLEVVYQPQRLTRPELSLSLWQIQQEQCPP
ncbi:MAG: glycosyltransferase family 39 protein [Elainellaceae cyanobacterium]